VAEIDYVFTRDNPLFAKLAASLASPDDKVSPKK
jgi:hypothetical protein